MFSDRYIDDYVVDLVTIYITNKLRFKIYIQNVQYLFVFGGMLTLQF